MGFDAIIIGSGFGGSITACRLAQAGMKVLVLERGRHWEPKAAPGITAYPRDLLDPWIWDQRHPENCSGWVDLRMFKGMSVVAGAGVGGGSLIYANVSIVPPADVFKAPWPQEINFTDLLPFFKQAADFLDVDFLPDNQINPRVSLLHEGAAKLGAEDRYGLLPVAINFRKDLKLDPANPPTEKDSIEMVNKHGAKQGTCIHAGQCDFGCPVKAKNTLDVNYLFVAQQNGAEVRPLHLVNKIEQQGLGYRVSFDRIDEQNHTLVPGSEDANYVIVAAGSLGSTEVLFRARDQFKTLPNISKFLGRNWSSNGDFLTPAFYFLRELYPTVGPTISSGIKFLDRSRDGQSFIIEDGGIPNLLQKHLAAVKAQNPLAPHPYESMLNSIQATLRKSPINSMLNSKNVMLREFQSAFDPLNRIMPWFANGVDAGNGEYQLNNDQLDLKWDVTKSIPAFEAELHTHETLSWKTAGIPIPNPFWKDNLITPHPLGGCNMGNTIDDGVVNHAGEVFGYRHLYVIDGAIIPTPLGVNPSRTISALAERAAEMIVASVRP